LRARPFPRRFFLQHAVDVARGLLGARLEKDGVGGVVVETEAYDQTEPACHAHKGERPRCRTLFLAGGHLYVYRIHQVVCANVSVGPVGHGSGVLFRALVPTHGLELVAARRATAPRRAWTDGPGKLCKALSIGLEDDGQDLVPGDGPVRLLDLGLRVDDADVVTGPRVGISLAVDLPWRFRLRSTVAAEDAASGAGALRAHPASAVMPTRGRRP
jgi:DNA-3-methyladenine glycosylase